MNPHALRAQKLIELSRPEQAEHEARLAIADNPDDAFAHGLLAVCLMHRDQLQEATQAAQESIRSDPGSTFGHRILSLILIRRNRFDEARDAAERALELDPSDVDSIYVLEQVAIASRDWPEALELADRALAIDPDHSGSKNLRAMALMQLGRFEEARAVGEGILARNPDDDLTHTTVGWNLLHQGNHLKAREHFQEALRLHPENESARAGMAETMKAASPLYRVLLRFNLFMSRLSGGRQGLLIIGLFIIHRILRQVARDNPTVAPFVLPLLVAYMIFAFWTWIGPPLANLVLRLNRYGRLALSDEQRISSTWFGSLLALALLLGAASWLLPWGFLIVASLVSGGLAIFAPTVWNCHPGWPRKTMAAYVGTLALLGFGAVAVLASLELRAGQWELEAEQRLSELAFYLFGSAILGFIFGQFILLWLTRVQPKN